MEKENFIHRNLGARNILVGTQNRVKVAGFGMTRTKDDPDFNFRRGWFHLLGRMRDALVYNVPGLLMMVMMMTMMMMMTTMMTVTMMMTMMTTTMDAR
jgi:hypothetical protein